MTLSSRVSAAMEQAGQHAARGATVRVRKDAQQAGWPAEAVNSLSVEHDGGHIRYHLADEHADWEYGTEDRPPSPVLRSADNRIGETDGEYLHHLSRLLRGVL